MFIWRLIMSQNVFMDFINVRLLLSGSCDSPLGLGDHSIPDSYITVTSQYDAFHGPGLARLNWVRNSSHAGAWCLKYHLPGEWLQVKRNFFTIFMMISAC